MIPNHRAKLEYVLNYALLRQATPVYWDVSLKHFEHWMILLHADIKVAIRQEFNKQLKVWKREELGEYHALLTLQLHQYLYRALRVTSAAVKTLTIK